MAEQQSYINKDTETGKTEKIPNFLANRNTCRKFCALYEECLSTIVESFPECKSTKKEYDEFVQNVKGNDDLEVQMIQQWHKDMLDKYTRADQHDNTLWETMPLFSRISVSEKINDPDLNSESVDIFWEYVDGMNRHSRMYNAIPHDMFEKIQSQAIQYKDKIQNGELNLDNMNWSDIQSMGEQLMGSINQRDIAELTNNLSGLAQSYKIQNVEDIFKLISDIPGLNDSAQNLQNMGVSNMIDQVVSSSGQMAGQQAPLQLNNIMNAMSQMITQIGASSDGFGKMNSRQ